ncbi:hypothetical protein AGMMS50268_35230 [Spirochaetia bacterium]|nr:hypothetical protein AGMMS50268_35230 [Spirochaetia bacterium]
MNTKKMVSILLILCALGTVVLFAETTDGVRWNFSESRGVTTLTNTTSRDLYVTAYVENREGRRDFMGEIATDIYGGGLGFLGAGMTKEIPVRVKAIRALWIPAETKW